MVGNILIETAKIDGNFTNIMPLAASEKFVGVLRYQWTVFIIFNIPL